MGMKVGAEPRVILPVGAGPAVALVEEAALGKELRTSAATKPRRVLKYQPFVLLVTRGESERLTREEVCQKELAKRDWT